MPKKKKLLIFLGAGSSIDQGFPSTRDVDQEVADWASQYVKEKKADPIDSFDARTRTNFYALLWKNRLDYSAEQNSAKRPIFEHRTFPNYERVLGDLHILMNGVLAKPFGDPMHKWVTRADVFSGLNIAPEAGDLDQQGSGKIFHAVENQLKNLNERLAKTLRVKSHQFENSLSNAIGAARFKPYRDLMATLAREFEIGVYNLNYDTVALSALPNSFVGFDRASGQFLAAEVLGRSAWGFLYHLHGSVHHTMKYGSHVMEHDDFGPKIVWNDDISNHQNGKIWQDSAELTTQSEEKRMLLTTLIAGGWKLDQLQEEPFLSLYSCISRHVYDADALLIGGYGFGDSHINSILRNALRSRANYKRRPPIIVIDYDEDRRPTAKRSGPWPMAMGKTLRVPPHSFRCHRSDRNALSESELKAEFELSSHAPIAIWNGGFAAAAQNATRMTKWLIGDHNAL
jgi:hypothetical protein